MTPWPPPVSTRVPALTVVIPVYRSAKILPDLLPRLLPALEQLADEHEVIFVDDHSPDESWEVIGRLAAEHPSVRGIHLMRNFGQHNALLCGIREARHDLVVTMDDDLQHPPEEIHKLLAEIEGGADMVYGTPAHEQHGFWRDMASVVTKIVLQNAMGADTARNVSAFRVFRTHLREAFANYSGQFVSIDVLLTWGTTKFAAVPVRHDVRAEGVSNYTFRGLVGHALNMLTGFSVRPLQLASLTGFLFTLFGLGILAYVLLRYLISDTTVPGFPFLASVIAIFSGAQLFALGIMGEYLARMHFRMMDRPPYAERHRTETTSAP